MPTVRPRTTVYLWEFLLQLLEGKESYAAISWLNRERGEFVLKDQGEIAKLWGKVKGRPKMDKIKLGRAMRYYYKKKLLVKVPRRKAVYRFVKFDALKQKEHETQRVPDLDDDLQVDVTQGFEKINDDDEALSRSDGKDENDMPLENLLVERRDDATQEHTNDPKLFQVEINRCQNQGNNSTYMSNSFSDYNSSLNGRNNSVYEDNSFSDIRSSGCVKRNYLSGYPEYGNIENNNNTTNNHHHHHQFNNVDIDTSHVSSSLYKSMFISDDLAMQEHANSESQQTNCGISFENVWQHSMATETASFQARNDHAIDPSMSSSYYLDDIDSDSALNSAFKELERLIMLNKLIKT